MKLKGQSLVRSIENPSFKKIPFFKVGDTVRMLIRQSNNDSKRVQNFSGLVIKRQGSGISATFTVRAIRFGVGVERTFPIYSSSLENLEVLSSGIVRRAKLYYIRHLSSKAARIKTKHK
ncbi:MAG: 50S ribosomal protein L19 [Candidatus Phytoplasma australasiaticum]|uniref:50S ribosomal protein L19 n=2 Tax=16SrII (Peanut WB group) TaxID=85621 RepID=A0A9K3ST31_9MOLU|nr:MULTISPECIES: 50S ribosomal protein L19 [Phytoplasma]MCG3566651.1 50S ribosomal protein L19 [Sesame phyllody phytoplasma]MDO8030991.1 50S ribosomal protein L19 [Candidatus Phytoplasma australasiaticum]MDO8031468.1 50S ribosomal protein L19 [Candidatus Phytoplasma australasiaticum]MDO8046479.1 50S ribosomal protein L19 [Candidatus Phytoplasma australasiaticum]MDO8053066.1 50S ribosomal protein L19 [Candidatus Phytoplasma australasiaticum]